MTLVRWEPIWSRAPWMGLTNLQMRMNHLLGDFFHSDDEPSAVNWTPRVEVSENEGHFEVTAELPGLEREDVKVELQDNVLILSGEKRVEREEKKDHNVYMCERAYGSFKRSFQLPAQVAAKGIKAEFKNGVLAVFLPKVEEARPKQIEVKVN